MIGAGGKVVELLLVDDDPDDIMFFVEGFRALSAPPVRVKTAGDVEEALRVLTDPPGGRLPDIVMLDIRLPGKSGFDLLERIRGATPPLSCLPVIMLSTSNNPADIRRAYCAHANCYIQKPLDMAGYARLAHCLTEFWLGVATLSNP